MSPEFVNAQTARAGQPHGIDSDRRKAGVSAIKTSVQYVMKHGMRGAVRNLWNSTIGLARHSTDWIEHKWRKFTKVYKCGFVGTTIVLTPTGFVQISDLHEGDAVLAAQESASGLAPEIAPIEREIFVPEASTLKVTLRHGDGEIEVIHTTDEHPFHIDASREWVRADALVCGDQISALAGPATILALSFDLERVPVYNLSISDAHILCRRARRLDTQLSDIQRCQGLLGSPVWMEVATQSGSAPAQPEHR